MKYEIEVWVKTASYFTVYVDAENKKEAEEKAKSAIIQQTGEEDCGISYCEESYD